MLTFEQFKAKLAETRAKVAKTFAAANPNTPVKGPAKLSSTQRRRLIRRVKTRPRAACDSFRWRHKHNHHPSGRLHGWKGKSR